MIRFWEFVKGILLRKEAAPIAYDADNEGALYNDNDTGIRVQIEGADRELVTDTQVQTLTNKTLTAPVVTSPVLTTPQINDTSSDHQYIFASNELVADRTVTLPLLAGNDEFTFNDHISTLTNKTLTSPKLNENVAVTTTATKLNYLTSATGTTGTASTNVVFSTSPTLVTPDIGVATATSINATAIPSSKTLVVTTDKLSVLAATTSAELAGVISDETGSGALTFANTPTLVTPVLGVATATSVNKVTLTEPATGSTLTIAEGKTLTASNTLTLTGTDASSVAFGAGGTVVYTGGNLSQFAATTSAELAGVISDETGTGALVFANTPTLVTPVLGVATATSINSTTIPASKTLVVTTDTLAALSATTSAQLAGVISDETGTGALVFASTPTLVTPVLGVATATSVNKVALTAPATSATLTIADGKTLTASNTLTFTGTDSSSVAFGAGGTVAYTGGKLSQFAATTSSELAGVISDETGTGSLVFATTPTLVTPLVDNYVDFNHETTPSNPAAGTLRIYPKNDNKLYKLTSAGVESEVGSASASQIAYLKDVKAAGTNSGTFTTGAYRVRDLNTIEGDSSIVSLSSNRFTLQAGTYHIEILAPAFTVGTHHCTLYNFTDSTIDIIGTPARAIESGNGGSNYAIAMGRIVIASAKEFDIHHRSELTTATNGFGIRSNFGISEIYTTVKITKV